MSKTYLDYKATCPIRPEVADVMQEVMKLPINASSVHSYGRMGRAIIDEVKSNLKAVTNANKAEIVLTSGGTEANNLAIKSGQYNSILYSATEHISVIDPAKNHPNSKPISVDENGRIDMIALEKLLAEEGNGSLVCVMYANNETGVIQPIDKIVDLVKKYEGRLFVDGIQALGKIAIDFDGMGVDMLSISSHKIGGPQGAGALIYNPKTIDPAPLIEGGGQEKKKRAGTENTAALKGFAVALQYVPELVKFSHSTLKKWHSEFEDKLKKTAPDIIIFSEGGERLPNTTCFASPNIDSSTQLIAYDMVGIMASNGAACSSGKVELSHVLTAMGVDKKTANTAIRISTGYATKPQDYEKFLTAWQDLYKRTRAA